MADKTINFVPYDKHHLEESTGPINVGDTITINMAIPMGANNARMGAAVMSSGENPRFYLSVNGGNPVNSMGNVSYGANDPSPNGPVMWTGVLTLGQDSNPAPDCMIQIAVGLPKGHPAK